MTVGCLNPARILFDSLVGLSGCTRKIGALGTGLFLDDLKGWFLWLGLLPRVALSNVWPPILWGAALGGHWNGWSESGQQK